MTQIEKFIKLLTGEFDNKKQYERLHAKDEGFPYAQHRNTVCNDKIKDLPKDFQGFFLVEESYYTIKGHTTSSSHLFLFMPEKTGVLLVSYEIPSGYDKNSFTYKDLLPVKYSDLKPNPRFTPTLFHEVEDGFSGESESMFSPVLKFCLKEHFSENQLEVQESMYMNEKKTFGFNEPICYQRIA